MLDHHFEVLRAGDLEATLSDYGDESVLTMPGNVLAGRQALRGFFQSVIEKELKPGSSQATIDSVDVVGEYALVTRRLRFEGGEYSFAADTYHVRDGKIVMHTSAFATTS